MDNSAGERKPLGEVIATSYNSFTVENYQLESTPPLGSLAVAQGVLGVVASAHTEGLGPISARGSLEDEDGSVYDAYPDLQRTLRSQFTALVVGCYEDEEATNNQQPTTNNLPRYTYPECPPRVHYKCWQASDAELVAFTARPDYLRLLLFSTEVSNVDQVVIHLIARAYRARGSDRGWLLSTAEYLGRQLKGQYDRLLAILKTLDAMTAGRGIDTNTPVRVGQVRL